MTAPERGTANIGPVFTYRLEFRHALNQALDPESVAIDPLAHL
jgi:hypothetical protein